MATDVLRARNILLPAPPQRIRAAAAARRRAAGSDSHHPGATATRRRSPAAGTSSPAAGRRHPGGGRARPAAEVYAGPSFSTSADASLLPLPQFAARKAVAVAMTTAVNAADATRDLRLILRLE
uniref:PRAS-rich protein n=1 Tax=Zea mays TaxID=4577 RepID=B6T088_MAIZE|nr:PRAS-rich protein [Zea mays]